MTHRAQASEWGNGHQHIVFLHYFGGAARSWQWVAQALSVDYHCVALNLPGFGGAPLLAVPSISYYTRAIWEMLDDLRIDKFTLVGHSMSGKFALQMASEDLGHRIEQLLLVAPSPPTVERMPAEEKKRMLRHPDLETAETTVRKATVRTLDAQRQALAVETQLVVDRTAWQWWLLEGMKHSIAPNMDQVAAPVTVLASEDDPVIPLSSIQSEVMKVVPHASLTTVQGVGHLLPLEAPEIVVEQLRKTVEEPSYK